MMTNNSTNANETTVPCGIFNVQDCSPNEIDDEDRFLALVIVALACAVCALCALVLVLSLLVHKVSSVWVTMLTRQAETDTNEARKGLLQGVRSSFASSDNGGGGGKKKKAAFVEDTSCAPPRDVDEEDL